MKKGIIAFLSVFLAFFNLHAYKPNSDDHVRFGVPSRNGIIVSRHGFISCYSPKYQMPVWVSYHIRKPDTSLKLIPKKTYSSDSLVKTGTADPSLYEGIWPYEPAKMAPAKHMPDKKTHAESYVTSNTCPMHHGMSRGLWLKLENMVYELAVKNCGLWVISGPVFKEKSKVTGTGLKIPDAFYKVLIYQDRDNSFRSAAFLLPNKPASGDIFDFMVMPAEVEKLTGLKFATALPEKVRIEMNLMKPNPEIIKGILSGKDCK